MTVAEVQIISRADAKARGLPRYFTGEPCRAGHVAERLVSGRTCVECRKARKQAPEYRAYMKTYLAAYQQTPEQRARRQSPEYRAAEKARQQSPARKASEKARNVIRRSLTAGSIVPLTPLERADIRALYAAAQRLTETTGEPWHVHHVTALSRGGAHHPTNMEVVPARINLAIGAKTVSLREYLLS